MLEEVDSNIRKIGWAKVNSFLLAAGIVLPFFIYSLAPGFYHGGGSSYYCSRELYGITSFLYERAFGTCMSACMQSGCCENEKCHSLFGVINTTHSAVLLNSPFLDCVHCLDCFTKSCTIIKAL